MRSVEAFKYCLTKIEYLLRVYSQCEHLSWLPGLKQPRYMSKRIRLASEKTEDALKLLNMIMINMSRSFELANCYYFSEVSARTSLYNTEEAYFGHLDEMNELVDTYYNFIKEKVGCP